MPKKKSPRRTKTKKSISMTARTQDGEARGRRTASSGPPAYDDKDAPDELVRIIAPCLEAVRSRMSASATLYLHLDYRAGHEAKVAADGIFGRGAFLGEIIWAPGNGGRGARGFTVTHQTILLGFQCRFDLMRGIEPVGAPAGGERDNEKRRTEQADFATFTRRRGGRQVGVRIGHFRFSRSLDR